MPKVFHGHLSYTLCTFVGCAIVLGVNTLGVVQERFTIAGIGSTGGVFNRR